MLLSDATLLSALDDGAPLTSRSPPAARTPARFAHRAGFPPALHHSHPHNPHPHIFPHPPSPSTSATMRAPHAGFVGVPGTLPRPPPQGGRHAATTPRPRRSVATPRRSLRAAAATPPAAPAAPPSPAAVTAPLPLRRERPDGAANAAATKRRSTSPTRVPPPPPPSAPPTAAEPPAPLTVAAAADADARAAAAAYAANLGSVIETLRSDYPQLLVRPPVGDIYTPDVAFVSAGLTTAGAGAYGALWWAVRSAARLLLVEGEVAVTSLYADAAAGKVYVRWRLTGVFRGGWSWAGGVDSAPWDRPGGVGGAGLDAVGWWGGAAAAGAPGGGRAASAGGGAPTPASGRRLVRDGMSVYTVGQAGLVVKHELVGAAPTRSRFASAGDVVDLWGGVLAGGGVGGGRLAGAGSGAGGGGGWRTEAAEERVEG